MKESLKVLGMVCEGCSTNVKDVVSSIEGVKDVVVDLGSGTLTYELDGATRDQIKEAVDDAGFDVEEC